MDTLEPARQPAWRKSSASLPANDCVEVAHLTGHTIGIRDSKDTGPIIALAPAHWRALIEQIKQGHHT